ncbi:MAG: ATPase [Betaproteobacteria bacterium]
MHTMITHRIAAAILAASACAAHADVKQASADGFVLSYARTLDVAPDKVYAVIPAVERWWNGDHTYSSDAANLSLRAEAGACFCERWKGNSVQHGTVVMAIRDQAIRIDGAFGPLQPMAVNAVLSIGTRAEGTGTVLTMVYRVNGSSGNVLDKLAPDVDQVLAEQFKRLVSVAITGKAVSP